ncbi:copper resistance system multicopper oxidase [Reyranella sp.]|jgi:CopA family copper-resistance protein|uniref:copper resistance system multicopper oxidase n=1 Tax=Reyranella sp. TaxID=1929291 RepID=UPI002F94C4CE
MNKVGTLTRRRFVEGLALATGLAQAGHARAHAAGPPVTLRGDRIDLTIGSTPVNFTGRNRTATTVNGSVPGPILRLREGDTVTLNVTNRLSEPTSIHWHGILLPNAMDGVPGLTFRGIMPGATFTYRFPIRQAGTYWYHSHSGMQEQTGLYGPLILEPGEREPYTYQRDYVVMLSDWTDEDPMTVMSNLKQQSDYYNYNQRTLGTFAKDVKRDGPGATVDDRLMWGKMRMSPTDIMDVTGATYTFLMNGQPPARNWTGLYERGEKVRLRFVNGASMSTFDVRIPGLVMTVVQADGSDVEPVEVEEFRIGVAETYDVIVTPRQDACTIFAQAQDRSGYARGTLAVREGLAAAIPPIDPRPQRTMADMGMSHGMGGMGSMDMSHMDMSKMTPGERKQHMAMMAAMSHDQKPADGVPTSNADGVDPGTLSGQPGVDNVAMETKDRLGEAGIGLDGNGRRNLTYRDLRALRPNRQSLPPTRALEFHLTGNMERFLWGFDGKKFSQAGPVRVVAGERIRFVLVNDTMMEHPIHLHGFLFEIENGQGDRLPLKHTINVKPAERMSFVFTADAPGHWAFHCHLLYHMEAGMFRTVLVS